MQWDIGLEIGQTAVRLCTRERGEVLCSPAWGARRGDEIIALGDEAQAMLGRCGEDVTLSRPVEAGVVKDARLLGSWMSRLLSPLISSSRLSKPSVLLTHSGFFHPSEIELMRSAVMELGAANCAFVESDILTAIGSDVNVLKPEGILVLRLGAGTMSAAVISYSSVAYEARRSLGSEMIDREIIRLLREECGLSVGPMQAEALKKELCAHLPNRDAMAEVTGLDLTTGFPVRREVSAGLIRRAVDPFSHMAVSLMHEVVGVLPSELCADLITQGMVLSGGGANIAGLDALMSERGFIRCRLAREPEHACVRGMVRVLQDEILSDLIPD